MAYLGLGNFTHGDRIAVNRHHTGNGVSVQVGEKATEVTSPWLARGLQKGVWRFRKRHTLSHFQFLPALYQRRKLNSNYLVD